MIKYMDVVVTIAPINSSESPRIIHIESNVPTEEIPENKNEVIRWVDKFEELGLDFDTGEYSGDVNNLPLEYDLGYKAKILYHNGMNTGVVEYFEIGGWRNPILLHRENYVKRTEYTERYPSLQDLKDRPLNEVIDYIKYLYNREEQ